MTAPGAGSKFRPSGALPSCETPAGAGIACAEALRPLRVLHTESSSNLGGQELRVIEQIAWMNANGHRAWLAARPGSPVLERSRTLELPALEVGFRNSVNPFDMGRIMRFCARERIDLIDCHSSRDSSAVVPARWRGTPVVRSQHMDKRLARGWWHRWLWRNGNHRVIAASSSIARRLAAEGLRQPSRISVVGEGVPLDLFHPDVSADGVRAELGVPESARLIVLVGMIRPDKGQKILVRAVDRIVEKFPDTWFLLAGAATRAEYQDELMREIAVVRNPRRIVLAGFREDIPRLLAAGDLVVICSVGVEAQSRVAPQAFAMRKLVVASAVGGVPELVKDGHTGFLYPPGDVAALVEKIALALESEHPRIRGNALHLARTELGFEHMMQKTLQAYRLALQD